MAETLEQCMARLREFAKERVDYAAFDGMPGWITNGWSLAMVGDSSGFPSTYRRNQAEHVLGLAELASEPLVRAPEYDLPTTTEETEEERTVVVEEGCGGCDCGGCKGFAPRTKTVRDKATATTIGQTVFRRSDGDLVQINPEMAVLLEGLDVSYDGDGMLVGRLGDRVVAAVMRIRSTRYEIEEAAKEYAAKQAEAPAAEASP